MTRHATTPAARVACVSTLVLAGLCGTHAYADKSVVCWGWDSDGIVDGADLGILLGAWATAGVSPADLTGDLLVDGADLGMLLSLWGTTAP